MGEIKFILKKELNKKEIVEIKNISENSSRIYSIYLWNITIKESLNLNLVFGIFYKDNKIIAFIPLYKRKILGINLYFSPFPGSESAYSEIVFRENNLDNFNKNIFYKILLRKCSNIFLTLPPENNFKSFFYSEGKTIYINFEKYNNKEELLKIMRKGHKSGIKKSLKNNLEFYKIKKNEEYLEFYKLLEITYKNSNISILPFKFYKNLFIKMGKYIELFLIKNDKKNIACIGVIKFNNQLNYWLGGSLKDSESLKLNANLFAQYNILEKNYRNFKNYDMLGANNETIARYKKGFGGDIVKYNVIYGNLFVFLLFKIYGFFGKSLQNFIRIFIRNN